MSFNFLTEAFDFSKIFGNVFSRWYYYVALAAVIISIVILSVCFKDKGKRNSLSNTQKIVYAAMLAAVNFLANFFTIKVSPVFQISFVAAAGFLSGYILGAGWGFAAAFTGDLICAIVRPFGAYNPIIGIGTGLFGFIPGVIFRFSRLNSYLNTVFSFLTCFIVCSFFVNTLGLSLMYSMTFESLLIQLPWKALSMAVNMALCIVFVSVLPKILPKDKFNL